MRCAVVYGRLPPKIRSEQAALFNDPESGYEVMVGSDAKYWDGVEFVRFIACATD